MRSLKILPIFSLLLSLSISPSLEASRSFDIEECPSAKQPKVSATSSSPYQLEKIAEDNTETESATQLVFKSPAVIKVIASFLPFKDMQILCGISHRWNIELHNENFLKSAFEELLPSTPDAFGMTRFQFLHFLNTPCLRALRDKKYGKGDRISISDDGTVLHYFNPIRRIQTKWHYKTQERRRYHSYIIDMSSDGRTILCYTKIEENGRVQTRPALFQNDEATPHVILPFRTVYGMSRDGRVILEEPEDSSPENRHVVLYNHEEPHTTTVPIKRAIPPHPCLLRDDKTVLAWITEKNLGLPTDETLGFRNAKTGNILRAAVWKDGTVA
ncbi:MAG: hypothetical protein ACTHJ4_03370, partial [Candidatus Nucleicultricaceae bacterium]